MLCSGGKTKLMIICNRETRGKLQQANKVFKVKVDGKCVKETSDEKLLGITMSNNMTWHTHLYGNKMTGQDKIRGLLPKLSQSIGILKQLQNLVTNVQLRNIAAGLFTSRVLYGIQLFSNVWGLRDMDDTSRRYTSFTKEDCRRLQVFQNKILRMIVVGSDRHTPTRELLEKSKELSIHQLAAFHTLQTVFKVVTNEKPTYLFKRLEFRKPRVDGSVFPSRIVNTIQVNYKLSLSRSGFVFRGSKLWNLLPLELRSEKCPNIFKRKSKSWILDNV